MGSNGEQIKTALQNAQQALLSELNGDGFWEGELSSSALATAVAAFALKSAGRDEIADRGLAWLKNDQHEDGGWGDSPESPSNFTATLLARCALGMEVGSPDQVCKAILANYGADQTFSVPILTMCMLSGKLGEDWSVVPQLPFELAAMPHKLYRFLNMPVVSYALPALIAIGLVRHKQLPGKAGVWRDLFVKKVLRVLESIQPDSGGFLEAAPLAGFVAMSLIAAGYRDHAVTQNCLRFLEETVRDDGSWPIDVSLSSWVTSLSIRALGEDLPGEKKEQLVAYLKQNQLKVEHPFTHAEPGGWGWTNQSGSVPDADDTAAALIAWEQLGGDLETAEEGILWLIGLQNRDGGMPTFCRGWGRLPFDKSCQDLTAHMIRAFVCWRDRMDENLYAAMYDSMLTGLDYLEKKQRPEGYWLPLWFGSQSNPEQESPVYGTVRVLEALVKLDAKEFPRMNRMRDRGFKWLAQVDLETLCLEELALVVGLTGRGIERLLELTKNGTEFPASPIGLYFASLWYSEKLYPQIFTAEALKRYDLNSTDN
jgi:squalene-hopene/tetraprenyl-beta-curcumene cyclase